MLMVVDDVVFGSVKYQTLALYWVDKQDEAEDCDSSSHVADVGGVVCFLSNICFEISSCF